ncbi:MAG: hypothetical protein JW864_07985 [Spirochaetes bacterium]|nr:hypothetical protein [Spirochaetota bacterium]
MMSGNIIKPVNGISKHISLLKILKLFFLFSVILIAGYFSGSLAGRSIVSSIITGKKSVFFLYRIPLGYIVSAGLLSSEDELKRTEGYYALLDNNMIDPEFLIERYKRETGYIKPLIIWLISFSKDKDPVLEFLSEEYQGADMRIKNGILDTMKRMDKSFFDDFVKLHGIDIDNM